jgi:hypothetical protein
LKKNTQFKVAIGCPLCGEEPGMAVEKKASKIVGWTELDERSLLICEKESSIYWLGIACISP